MRSQSIAAFALLTATVSIAALTASVNSATAREAAEKETIRTDRYGDPLPKGAIMRIGTARFSQPSPGNLIFSPDGKFLISAGFDKRIRIWDADTGKEVRVLEGHKGGLSRISLSADGKLLASCGRDGDIFLNDIALWELDSGKVRRRFRCPDRVIQILSLSPNGKLLATSNSKCFHAIPKVA